MAHPRSRGTLLPGDVLIVVHDFEARSSDELTLRKQDRIELVELDDGFGDGWYLGRHLGQGATGLFPGVYTIKLPYSFTTSSAPASKATSPQPVHSPLTPHSAQFPQLTPISPVSDYPMSNDTFAALPMMQSPPPTLRVSAVPAPSPYVHGQQRSIGQALSAASMGDDSPVMNETLSVIDEHITDLSTPRQSLAPPQLSPEDSESDYSRNLDSASYIAGPETESEDNGTPSEAEVKAWSARQTADYLRSVGVDPSHCAIFEEQEITGDVLLEMDQSFIHMKEFDFGLMGRRLKTWHKIRDLQAQVKAAKHPRLGSFKYNTSTEDIPRMHSRGLSGNTILPRIPSLAEEPGLSIRPSLSPYPHSYASGVSPTNVSPSSSALGRANFLGSGTPPSPWRASMAVDSPSRPSAASIRDLNHSRRHSSMDYARNTPEELAAAAAGAPVDPTPMPHRKNASLDRDWSLSNATTAHTGARTPSLRLNIGKPVESVGTPTDSAVDESPMLDLDRGYFSGNELDNRKHRNLLRKKDGSVSSPTHSRRSSAFDDPADHAVAGHRHSRLSSVDSSRDKSLHPTSLAARAYYNSKPHKGRFRSASALNPTYRASSAQSPTVTNLEDESGNISAISSPRVGSGSTSPATGTGWVSSQKARKLLGIRAASEAVTGSEKENLVGAGSMVTDGALKESPTGSPSGSQPASLNSRSIEMDNTDASSRGTGEALGPLLHTTAPVRTKPKTKKQTSAYTRGLLKLTPAEARKNCDYHGWMKKKSTGLMTSWKPRLFILRGRRLSYYYSEDDTEEKGIIDISGHKVLVDTDPMTTLHATITGAASSPNPASGGSSAETSPPANNKGSISGGGTPFYFKLVPPKSGSSRAVQFTKPTVHHFQADNIHQGRKWMGEIMKATIEHDLSTFETTNRQKTISLAKARARKERPPALKGTEDVVESPQERDVPPRDVRRDSGLNITGLKFIDSDVNLTIGVDVVSVDKKPEHVAETVQAAS